MQIIGWMLLDNKRFIFLIIVSVVSPKSIRLSLWPTKQFFTPISASDCADISPVYEPDAYSEQFCAPMEILLFLSISVIGASAINEGHKMILAIVDSVWS